MPAALLDANATARTPRRLASRPARAMLAASLIVAALTPTSRVLWACPYSIRDSAFIGRASMSPFRLLLVDRGMEDDARRALEASAARAQSAWLRDTNLIVETVDLDREEARFLPDAVRTSVERAALPAAALLSPDGRALLLGALDVSDRDAAVAAFARAAIESPLRSRLPEELVRSWCAILLVPGTDEAANAAARGAIHTAAGDVIGHETELGKTVDAAPTVLEVPADSAQERVLLWALGLAADDSDTRPTRAVVLAGRGETRGPVLEGAGLNAATVASTLEMLGRSCSCTTSSEWLIGRTLPLSWSADTRERARTALGFDPEDPEVLRSVRGDRRDRAQDIPLAGLDGFDELGFGYEEVELEPLEESAPSAELIAVDDAPDAPATAEPAIATTAPTSSAIPISTEPPPTAAAIDGAREARTSGVALVVGIALAVLLVLAIAVGGTTAIAWGRRQRP